METRATRWKPGGGEARNRLVRPNDRIEQESICRTLFEETESPRAVVVSYERSVEDWLSTQQGAAVDSVAFVSVGETVRSTATATTAAPRPTTPLGDPIIDGVGDPTDLAALGLAIHSHLREFHESGNGALVVCFDSLSALLAAVPVRRAFRFLHLLTNLITTYGATAHYHYDANRPTTDLDTLRPLFDAELDTHGSHDTSTWTLHPEPHSTADT